ncbi:hypothetical protein QFC22_001413 [Naganishia vaughanmartiniae]|uniref:Uncharacterized protein n=1 Tax=Naganishia vaughanmartiniae TaxID=1424756 RepID=A0ACC2XGS2_9TREE|nr:hypothetical protein QFC22_001413 [Naganishia vaughanmartiniae]
MSSVDIGMNSVGNYERYSLARDTTGNPQLITYIATYPIASSLPSVESLRLRARNLVEDYPLLRARVIDSRTISPKWGLLSDGEVEKGILGLVTDVELEDLAGYTSSRVEIAGNQAKPTVSAATLEKVISQELGNDQPLQAASNNLLWRVTRYRPRTRGVAAFLALTINHVISDGKSGLALFDALLGETKVTQQPSKETSPPSERFPRALETTVDCRPGYGFMMGVIWNELLIPRLPEFIAKRVKRTACWPGVPPLAGLPGQQIHRHLSLSSRTLAKLKATGKRHQVDTLHPIFEIAAVAALWCTIVDSERPSPLIVGHSTPISIRDGLLSHPIISGNYVAGLDTEVSCSAHGEESFWQETRKYAEWLRSTEGRQKAIQTMGMLVHIPDGQNEVDAGSPAPTGWETFLLDKASRAPAASIEVSNLGYLPRLPPSASSVTLAQTNIFGPPIIVNAVGHATGTDFVICWRTDAFALSKGKKMEDFVRAFAAVLECLAEEKQEHSTQGETSLSFADLRDAVTHKGTGDQTSST